MSRVPAPILSPPSAQHKPPSLGHIERHCHEELVPHTTHVKPEYKKHSEAVKKPGLVANPMGIRVSRVSADLEVLCIRFRFTCGIVTSRNTGIFTINTVLV